jgi:transcriptional regulator with XRE-family HTH domain
MNPVEEALIIIGKQIRAIRKQQNLSAEKLADMAGIRTATVLDIENGQSNFQFTTILRITSALNCNLDINITPSGT